MKRFTGFLAVLLLGLVLPLCVHAQWEPKGDITFIVPYREGGGTDICAKALLKVAPKYTKQKISIVYIEGGAGAKGVKKLAKAKPNGRTLGFINLPTFATRAYLPGSFYKVSDIRPICGQNTETAVMVVRKNSGYKNMHDIVKAAKSGKKISAVTNGERASYHIAAMLFADSAGIDVEAIHGEGTVVQMERLLNGEGDFACLTYPEVKNLAKDKEDALKIVGVFSEDRIAILPDIPTLAESGYYSKWYGTVRGVVAPSGTPDEIIEYYDALFKKMMQDPEAIREHFKKYMLMDYTDHNNFEAVIKAIDFFCNDLEKTIFQKERR